MHVPEDVIEWLALMQHFGAPTRLLDFTQSPYVATYFAVEDATEDSVIWAVNESWVRNQAGRLALEKDERIQKAVDALHKVRPTIDDNLAAGLLVSLLPDKFLLNNTLKLVIPIETRQSD